jgi:stearoyl-CoA desaturase (delta-9 desaturase)
MKYSKTLISWMFYLFLLTVPLWAIGASWTQFVACYLMFYLLLNGIQSLFLHRWAAHGSWNPPVWLQNILATIGVAALLGTPISWAAWHRTHHAHNDTEKDPHSPAHKSWFYIVFRHHYHSAELRRGIDRAANKYFRWLGKHEIDIAIGVSLVLLVLLGPVWFATLWAVPVALTTFCTNLGVNVLCHTHGKVKNYPLLWPVVFDECMHKDHHDNPSLVNTPVDIMAKSVVALGLGK